VRRREFIGLLSGAAAGWPLAARAQQANLPVIGFLHSASSEPTANLVKGFRKGLFDIGFVEGQNVSIEFRWADNQNDRLPKLAADLVRRNVSVIATPGSSPAALAAKGATSTIPIVFAGGADPVSLGLVNSINHPGGNVTGVYFETVEMQGKAFELMHQLVPNALRFTALINPTYVFRQAEEKNMQAGAATLGLQLEVLNASTDDEIENAFKVAAQRPGTPLIIGPDPFYTSRRYAVPAMYDLREFAEAGGLIS
jgi:ABC-type uncharacterized transport system substrate-binding protein